MSNNIIELRSQAPNSLFLNDDFTSDFLTNFDKPYILEEGDELSVKSVFCDTRSKVEARININDNNNEFHIRTLLYVKNYDQPARAGSQQPAADFTFHNINGSTIPRPDGNNYYLAYRDNSGENGLSLDSLTIKGGCPEGARVKSETARFTYTDVTGKPAAVILTTTSESNISGNKSKDVKFTLNGSENLSGINIKTANANLSFDPSNGDFRMDQNDIIKLNDKDITLQTGLSNLEHTQTAYAAGDSLFPYLCDVQFDIPNGDYEPDALARLINDKVSDVVMTQNTAKPIGLKNGNVPVFVPVDKATPSTFTNFPTKTPYLTSLNQLLTDADFGFFNNDTNSLDSNVFLIDQAAQSVIELNTTPSQDYLFGTNQMFLNYDQDLQKFVFQSVHSPLIGGAAGGTPGSSEVVRYIRKGTSAAGNNDFNFLDSYSGIAFHSCPSQKTHNLLVQEMGFDGSLFVQMGDSIANTYGSGGSALNNIKVEAMIMTPGKSTTSNLRSLDAVYQKNSESFFIMPSLNTLGGDGTAAAGANNGPQDTISSNTLSIIGERTISEQTGELSGAYFLVEISGLPNQNIINNPSQRIQAIVGRYYATSDYTEDTGAGSIGYIHMEAEPMVIRQLKVRILNPDGSLADLGNDNTIFLQIQKQVKEKMGGSVLPQVELN